MVFVVDREKRPLMPCHPSRARQLLKSGKTVIFLWQPFTILLRHRVGGDTQEVEVKIDLRSKTTGIALVGAFKLGHQAIWASHLHHRGDEIEQALESRRSIRRYRKARFDNRARQEGRLPPSLLSRIHNTFGWIKKLMDFAPITKIAMELVKFYTQKMPNQEISGSEYSSGSLMGYEVRQFLLEKHKCSCVYCGKKQTRLEMDHVIPRSQGGSDRPSNLVLACRECNQKKGSSSLESFLSTKPEKLLQISQALLEPLRDVAAVNASKGALSLLLSSPKLPLALCSAAQTYYNRFNQALSKNHWIDAICVSDNGVKVMIPPTLPVLEISATGRGSRQMTRVDRYGFPRTGSKAQKRVHGFQTGDLIQAKVTSGKKTGTYQGRASVRTSGSFNIKTSTTTVEGISSLYCQLLQKVDGYMYTNYKKRSGVSSGP